MYIYIYYKGWQEKWCYVVFVISYGLILVCLSECHIKQSLLSPSLLCAMIYIYIYINIYIYTVCMYTCTYILYMCIYIYAHKYIL